MQSPKERSAEAVSRFTASDVDDIRVNTSRGGGRDEQTVGRQAAFNESSADRVVSDSHEPHGHSLSVTTNRADSDNVMETAAFGSQESRLSETTAIASSNPHDTDHMSDSKKLVSSSPRLPKEKGEEEPLVLSQSEPLQAVADNQPVSEADKADARVDMVAAITLTALFVITSLYWLSQQS